MFGNPAGWFPPKEWKVIQTLDMHTAGEPLRIITGGLPEIPGSTILEKRKYFRDHLDYIRTGLMLEPRGHADMYGAVITKPVTPNGDFGAFFLHNEGFSTMCGHAMVALVKMAIETGLVARQDGKSEIQEIIIDAPPGQIIARGMMHNNLVTRSFFRNVPSFVLLADKQVEVPGLGRVQFDVAYGGAFYAFVDAAQLNLNLDPCEINRLIDYGRRIKQAVIRQFDIRHPFEEDLSFLYGTIFTGPAHAAGHHSRNVCIFADGEVDRSPTGSGVSARAALHHVKGQLPAGKKVTIESVIGTTMTVEIVDLVTFGQYPAVIPEVSGEASFTGRHEFFFDPEDPLRLGFFLR